MSTSSGDKGGEWSQCEPKVKYCRSSPSFPREGRSDKKGEGERKKGSKRPTRRSRRCQRLYSFFVEGRARVVRKKRNITSTTSGGGKRGMTVSSFAKENLPPRGVTEKYGKIKDRDHYHPRFMKKGEEDLPFYGWIVG